MTERSCYDRDHVACQAQDICSLDLYRKVCCPQSSERDNREKDHSGMMCERQEQGNVAEPGGPGGVCVLVARAARKVAFVEMFCELRHEGEKATLWVVGEERSSGREEHVLSPWVCWRNGRKLVWPGM